MIELIKEYKKYKSKPTTSAAVVLNMAVFALIPLILLWVLFANISKNTAFGLLIAFSVCAFLYLEAAALVKMRIEQKLPSLRERYNSERRIKCLTALSEEEFKAIGLKYLSLAVPELEFRKDGLFYSSGRTVLVFLWLPEKRDIPIEKADMAFKAGAKSIITVSSEKTRSAVEEKFGERLTLAVTLDEMIALLPELDYTDDGGDKKRFDWHNLINMTFARRLLKVSLWCLALSFMVGNIFLYISMAGVMAAAALIIATRCKER